MSEVGQPVAGAMLSQSALAYRDGELWCEDVRVAALVERFGSPLYVYSARAMAARYDALRAAFGPDAQICFAVKSNGNLSLLRWFAERGAGFVVDGLRPQNGDADGMCGRIEFPDFDNGGGNFILDESIADAGFAMPRDLNGDNDAFDTFDTGYRLLPVRVWVEWAGVSGNRSIRFETMLSQR